MKIGAVVCEYNPFHNGHKYQLDYARDILCLDAIVGIMSGNFVQRGDVAIYPKENRAKAALMGGLDLVLELPTVLTLQSAERYAYNAVATLDALGCVDVLFFGAECPDTDLLMRIAEVLAVENEAFQSVLRERLAVGLSFAAARAEAIREVIGSASAEILSKPNNILAVEYCKAIIRLNSKIIPFAIKRKEVDHNSKIITNQFASATAIRERILNNEDVTKLIPQEAMEIYSRLEPYNISKMDKAILANLCLMPLDRIKEVVDVSEGLENSLKKGALSSKNCNELIEKTKSKRYAYSRIRRIVLNSYLGITKEDAKLSPSYIRILDFNEKGQSVLNFAKGTATLPLAKNGGQIKGNDKAQSLWQRELAIDRIYDLFKGTKKEAEE